MSVREVSGVRPVPRKGPLRDRDPCGLRAPGRPGSGSGLAVHVEALTHSVSSRKIAPNRGRAGMQAVGVGEGGKEEKLLETSVGETFTVRLWEDRTRGEIYVPSYDPPGPVFPQTDGKRSEEHTSELQSQFHLVCRLLLEKKKKKKNNNKH